MSRVGRMSIEDLADQDRRQPLGRVVVIADRTLRVSHFYAISK